MNNSYLESIIGLMVLIIAFIFLFYSWGILERTNGGKIVKVEFGNIGSLKVGDEVRISGIKVGEVFKSILDYETFNALVFLSLSEDIDLPDDSMVKISNSSLLGGNYIEIIPGASDENISSGGTLYNSIDSISFTDLLGKAIFSNSDE